MATPQGAAVSNAFRILMAEIFVQEVEALFPNVQVEAVDEAGDVGLYPGQTRIRMYALDGYWPIESDNAEPVNFFEFISKYIVSDELAILHAISMQGPDDVRFQSVSIAELNKIRNIELPQVEALHRVVQSMGN